MLVILLFPTAGDQLKKYLEPVLKKCGLDKLRPRQPSKDSAPESEDSSHHNRPRTDSITEAISESEGDAIQTATTSTASTPHTPPTLPPRKSSTSSTSSCDFFAPPFIHYPFSSLNLISFALCRTPSESSPSIQGLSSPGVTTPSSIDSGISLRHSSFSLRSPSVDLSKLKKGSRSSQLLPPLPPPEENAPPLPPPPQDSAMPPPPLPPLPPAPSEDGPRGGGGISNDCGIENISSDEDEPSVAKPPLPRMRNGKMSSINSGIKPKGIVSPASSSPSNSPRVGGTGKAVNGGIFHAFDPALGLQNLLAARARAPSSSLNSSSPSLSAAPSNTAMMSSLAKSSKSTTNSTTASSNRTSSAKSSPYVGSSSPRPLSSTYELEVEEISGDESPVMVCFEPLKVETISDDDMDLGDEDMEMCSDDENAQDSVIEVNVKTSSSQSNITSRPMVGPHMPHPPLPPLPQEMRPNSGPHPLPPPPPIGYFPPPPPPGTTPFPPHPPPPHLPPLPPTSRADFEFVSPPHPARPPHMMLHPPPPHEPVRPRPYHNSPPPRFINDIPLPHLPNGYIGRHPPSRSFSKSKMLKGFSPPKNKRESISQDVLCKAMEQLRLILLNDVHKKIVENSAYPVLDSHWEKREKEVIVILCMCVHVHITCHYTCIFLLPFINLVHLYLKWCRSFASLMKACFSNSLEYCTEIYM